MMKRLFSIAVFAVLLLPVDDAVCAELASPTDQAVLMAVVHTTAQGLGAVAVNEDGTYNAPLIRKYVNAVRFFDDQTGYLYVYDYTNNVNIAHATLKDFPGHDKTSYQDSRGMYVIQELSKIAKSKAGRGPLVYYWNNPKTMKEEKKLGYVEVIPSTTLYVGSGIYVEKGNE